MIRTVSIPLRFKASVVLPLMAECAKVFNEHVDWAVKNKSYNKNKAHKAIYQSLRNQYPSIPAALIQSMRDMALESVKATKFKRIPRKRKTSAIRFDLRTMSLRGQKLTFSTLSKRVSTIIKIPDFFSDYVTNGKFKGGNLLLKGNKVWANLWFKLDDVEKLQGKKIIGIDLGLRNAVVTSEGKIFKASKIRAIKRRYLYIRKKLQAKGTRSAKRRLKKLSGKEKRFSKDFNHQMSKQIAALDCQIFAVEDLKGIRKKHKRKEIKDPKNRKRNRQWNKQIHSWPFYQFLWMLEYKAAALGKQLIKVNPAYTSQTCSTCSKIDKNARFKSHYSCSRCGLNLHADINAAINIKNKILLAAAKPARQVVVNQPNVAESSDDLGYNVAKPEKVSVTSLVLVGKVID